MNQRLAVIQGHVITCSPWWSNLIYEAASKGEHEKVKEFATKAAVELALLFQWQTRRRVLSVQAHFDTTSLHWHLFSTRIGPDHKLIRGTTKAIGLVGPWAVGVVRQGEAGLLPEDATNLIVARRLMRRNEARMGNSPVDWQMARLVDSLCYAAFGASPRLAFWLGEYRHGLLGLCVDRLTALRDATNREIVRYRAGQDYAEPEVGFGESVLGGTEVLLH